MSEMSDVVTTTVAGFTDIGMVRSNNEDNFLIADLNTGRVFLIPQRIEHNLNENRLLLVVSDGVGGANSGEIASSMAVHSMRVELLRRTSADASPFERLVQAVEKANSLIWTEGQANPDRRGMGATITAVLIERNIAYIAEIGDSRGYIIHNGRIKQVTTDQSLVSILVSRGLMTPEQAESAPTRNIILQSLGCQAEIKVAVTSIELAAGDYLLLCSDGLSGKVKNEEMLNCVENTPSLEEACRLLIDLAKQRGGEDNITIVIARMDGVALKPSKSVPCLTTRIEVLSAFDPEDNASKKAKTPTPANTKILGSEHGSGESIYTRTLGNMKNSQVPQHGRAQLMEHHNESDTSLTKSVETLHKQIVGLQDTIYWAQQVGKDISPATLAIKKLEKIIAEINVHRLLQEEADKLITKLLE
jgi:serine/threonine protein phosphatase PrpC